VRRSLGFSAIVLALAAVLVTVGPVGASGHYVPRAGDSFGYSERILLTNGQGNYTGYTEESYYNGSLSVSSVLPNGTESASYQSGGTYQNSQGQHYPWSESGTFSFSADSYHYVQGTDNQTGYVNPYVWFFMNNSLAAGSSFFVLNSHLLVVSTDATFPLALSHTGYVAAIFAEGNGSYQRNDEYGVFSANYNWKAYFDPGTGYILGYVYTEVDSDASGNGFTWTDTLTDTRTSFPVTPATAPPSMSTSSSSTVPWTLVVLAGVVLLVVIVAALLLARRRGSSRAIPRHAASTAPGGMPSYAPPPALNLIPRDQPPVQQVVIRETVKVPCKFCGTLIDSTATVCPQCGAPRT
jgi:hypothetical protein